MEFDILVPEQIAFLVKQIEAHETAKEASTLEAVTDIFAMGIISPLVEAARVSEDPSHAVSFLLDLTDEDALADFAFYINESAMPPDEKASALANIEEHGKEAMRRAKAFLCHKAAELALSDDEHDNVVSSWLYDTVKLREEGDGNRLPRVKRGIINIFRSSKSYVKKQSSLFAGMRRNVRNAADLGTWYSRYTLAPAIDNAREGYVSELAEMCSRGDAQIVSDCAKLAGELGMSASPDDFDIMKIRQSMRMLCRARTGYSNPLMFLMSILPVSELERIKARRARI